MRFEDSTRHSTPFRTHTTWKETRQSLRTTVSMAGANAWETTEVQMSLATVVTVGERARVIGPIGEHIVGRTRDLSPG